MTSSSQFQEAKICLLGVSHSEAHTPVEEFVALSLGHGRGQE